MACAEHVAYQSIPVCRLQAPTCREQILLAYAPTQEKAMTQIVAMFIALAGLCVLLYGLEWALPAVRAQPLWRPDSRTDVLYLVLTPFVIRAVSKLVELTCVALVLHAIGHAYVQHVGEGFGPLVKQPPWLILIEMFLVGDLLGYWIH